MGYRFLFTPGTLSSRDVTVFNGLKPRLVYVKGVDHLRPRINIALLSYYLIVLKDLKPKPFGIGMIFCLRLYLYGTPQSNYTILC